MLQIQSLSNTHEKSADVLSLNKEIESCRRTLTNVQNSVPYYARSLSQKGSGNMARDIYYKLRWQTRGDQLAEAQRLVKGHYHGLQIQLSLLGINLADANTRSLVNRFDKTESMLLQITDAVQSSRGPGDSNLKFEGGNVGGVLLSGLIKNTNKAVQSVLFAMPDGPVPAVSIDAAFEEVALQCQRRYAAINEHCQRHNICFRDIDFEIDTDLASDRRMCLDGLDLSEQDNESLDPKSAKRIRV